MMMEAFGVLRGLGGSDRGWQAATTMYGMVLGIGTTTQAAVSLSLVLVQRMPSLREAVGLGWRQTRMQRTWWMNNDWVLVMPSWGRL